MTLLEIVQRICRRIGYQKPLSLDGLDEDQQEALDWVKDAYNRLQLAESQWSFLWFWTTATLINGTREYLIADLGLTGCDEIETNAMLLDANTGERVATLSRVPFSEIDKAQYSPGAATSGVPSCFSFDNGAGKVSFNVAPSNGYQFRCHWRKEPYVMMLATDEPVFASKFHDVLYWLALNQYAVVENDPELYSDSDYQYRRIYNRMLLEYTPQIHIQATRRFDTKVDGQFASSDSTPAWYS